MDRYHLRQNILHGKRTHSGFTTVASGLRKTTINKNDNDNENDNDNNNGNNNDNNNDNDNNLISYIARVT